MILRFLIVVLLSLGAPLMSMPYNLPFTFTGQTGSIFVATDENGHAIAAYRASADNSIITYYFSNNTWTLLQIPGCPLGTVQGLVMHSTGTALLTYMETTSNDLRSLYFNGSMWTVPSLDPLDTAINSGGVLAINANGDAAVVWSNGSTQVRVNMFQNGAWGTASSPAAIGTGTGPMIGINQNDDLGVGFNNGTNVVVRAFLGGVWSSATTLNTNASLNGVGIDNAGHVTVLVRASTGNIIAYYLIGGTLNATTTLNPGSPAPANTASPILGVTSLGTAVAAWRYANAGGADYRLFYNQFDGTTWGSAVAFITGTAAFSGLAFSLNTGGDALFFWGNPTGFTLTTGFLPVGGLSMSTPTNVGTTVGASSSFAVSLADNNFDALAWVDSGTGASLPFGMALYLLAAPTNFHVQGCYDRSGDNQTNCINSLAWDYSANPNIASYNIYKDGVFIANVPVNDPQSYTDPNQICGEEVVYTLETVNLSGVSGQQASVTLNGEGT